MIVGTFNQQRRTDYTADEWQLLVENKQRRQSPLDDGVAYLLRAFGYNCIWDDITNTSACSNSSSTLLHHNASSGMMMKNDPSYMWSARSLTQTLRNPKTPPQTNWNPNHPPPATHWTGTIVDYTYIKDHQLELSGVYVSPNPLSDHRLVVCDWDLPIHKTTRKKKRTSTTTTTRLRCSTNSGRGTSTISCSSNNSVASNGSNSSSVHSNLSRMGPLATLRNAAQRVLPWRVNHSVSINNNNIDQQQATQ